MESFLILSSALFAASPIVIFLAQYVRHRARVASRELIEKASSDIREKILNVGKAGQSTAPIESFRVPDVIRAVLLDKKVSLAELQRFTEYTVLSYIKEQDSVIEALHNANREKDFQVRSLFYLSKRMMEDNAHLSNLTHELIAITHPRSVEAAIARAYFKDAIRVAAYQLSAAIHREIPEAPKRISSVADPSIPASLSISSNKV